VSARPSRADRRLRSLTDDDGPTYESAGVSLATAEAIVDRLRAAVDSTRTPQVAGAFGAFAGLYALDERRLLAASTDGVGSKLMLARQAGRLRSAGADLAAHCINEQVAELVEGAADVCREAGCALIGGETAELPGIYRDEELDFAGTCIGLVEREQLIDGSRVARGDLVIGFPSAGVHANGFTLVRRVLEEDSYEGDDLLAPTRLYLDEARALRRRTDVRALAHVTGGGIVGNLSRVLPAGLTAEIDWDAWERLPVFDWLAQHVDEDELRRVFNLGIGYCAVVPAGTDGDVIGRIA
jgi:phosphoribosylformylglycinamidine cyclo-ligase